MNDIHVSNRIHYCRSTPDLRREDGKILEEEEELEEKEEAALSLLAFLQFLLHFRSQE